MTRPARRAGACLLALVLPACGGREPEPPAAAQEPALRVEPSAPADSTLAARQAEVARRGAGVMPFDLERTTHAFRPTPEGGVQTVVARDLPDAEQVRLVREHLRDAARRFAAGDFGDPAEIHGEDMPGLAELRAGHERVRVTYEEVEAGARITYATQDAALARAIHDWFRAQTSDHGSHARHEDGG
ncbi:MAG: aspartate carbamoyltransferase [Gemmatimonadota bacterium]